MIKTLLWPLIYGLFVQGPLYVLDIFYKAFSWLCGFPIGQELFNATNGVEIDFNSIGMQMIFFALIALLILIFIGVVFVAIKAICSKKQVIWIDKVKWIIVAFASILGIPVAFILLTSLSSALMMLISPQQTSYLILADNWTAISNDIQDGLDYLEEVLRLDKDFTYNGTTASLQEWITALQQALMEISTQANNAGMSDVVSQCNDLITNLGSLTNQIANFNNIINDIEKAFAQINDQVIHSSSEYIEANQEVYDLLNDATFQLTQLSQTWNSIVNGCNNLYNYYSNLFGQDIIVNVHGTDIAAWNLIAAFGDSDWKISTFGVIDSLFIDSDKYSSKCLVNVLFQGGTWQGSLVGLSDVNISQYNSNLQGSFDGGFNAIIQGVNPSSQSDFELVILIYQMATGNTDTNWQSLNWGSSFTTSWTELAVGAIAAIGSCIVMLLFFLFAAKRVFELIILIPIDVVMAGYGVIDDGNKFGVITRLIVSKIFSVLIISFVFLLGIGVSSWLLDLVDMQYVGGSLERMLMQIGIIIAGLLASFFLGNWLTNLFGDNQNPMNTLAELGVLSMAGRYGKSVAKFTGKALGKAGGKAGSSVLNSVGDAMGLNKQITGSEKISSFTSSNKMNAVKNNWMANQGILNKYTDVVGNKAKSSFSINNKNKNAQTIWEQVSKMNSKQFKEFRNKYASGGK